MEHLGEWCEEYENPGSIECMRKVNEVARANWEKYVADEMDEPMVGHLVSYPITVEQDGTVGPLEGFENFPDTEAAVLGGKSALLVEKLTT